MKIHKDVISRYVNQLHKIQEKELVTGVAESHKNHLLWMLDQIDNYISDDYKAHRWLGFIQAMLISDGWTNVAAEREFTRPYFTKSIVVDMKTRKDEVTDGHYASEIVASTQSEDNYFIIPKVIDE